MAKFGFETTGEEAASALSSNIQGKTIIITGVSPRSLGYETARVIAIQEPKLLVLAGRSSAKLQEVEKELKEAAPGVNIRQLILDLESQEAVRKAAEEVNGWKDVPTVDILLNNAGIMAQPYQLTMEGIESQFGTNHIGHFLFTQLIIGKVLAAGEGKRIVNVSSNAYAMGPVRFDDYNFQKSEYNPWASYAQSKSANVLYSKALAQKYKSKGLVAFSLHPGAIWTNLGLHAKDDLKTFGIMDNDGNVVDSESTKWKNLGQGVSTSVVACFDSSIADQSGAYLTDCVVTEQPEEYIQDPEGPEKLWKLSEKLVGQKFE